MRPKVDDPDELNIEILGKDAGRIIGKKGAVLQAIQFLTHRVINRPGLDRRHVLVDAEGYRSRRDDSLATMARRLGKQAVDQGKIITFEPMNPRDRRVVHLALAKFEGVITKSDGEGDDRRVQIIPVRR
jgi:spoIIIJ-associated protein